MELVEFLRARLEEDEQRFDAERFWLAEIEAKRRIIDHAMSSPRADRVWFDEQLALIKLFALPYSDHPDYDDSWRPASRQR